MSLERIDYMGHSKVALGLECHQEGEEDYWIACTHTYTHHPLVSLRGWERSCRIEVSQIRDLSTLSDTMCASAVWNMHILKLYLLNCRSVWY